MKCLTFIFCLKKAEFIKLFWINWLIDEISLNFFQFDFKYIPVLKTLSKTSEPISYLICDRIPNTLCLKQKFVGRNLFSNYIFFTTERLFTVKQFIPFGVKSLIESFLQLKNNIPFENRELNEKLKKQWMEIKSKKTIHWFLRNTNFFNAIDSKSIVFLGNALLDISAKCDQKLLEKYNLKVDDNCEAEDWQLPIFDKLLAMPDVITTPGRIKFIS